MTESQEIVMTCSFASSFSDFTRLKNFSNAIFNESVENFDR